MEIELTAIDGVRIIHTPGFEDERGFFAELYDSKKFAALGIDTHFVLDAISRSTQPFTLRGMHFQAPPHAQAKLVRVNVGAVFDVAVDLRRNSTTFGQHVAVTLTAGDGRALFIPEGFAHGFCTLESDTEISYKLSDHYMPETAGGIAWNDPALKISWPAGEQAVISTDRDKCYPLLAELSVNF